MRKIQKPESISSTADVAGAFEPEALAVGPDGAPVLPQLDQPEPPPPATPEYMLCLRGPCRHYWELVVPVAAGNPRGTWRMLGVAPPRQTFRTCTAHPGTETELDNDAVIECSRWDPVDPHAQQALEERRETYYRQNPDIPRDAGAAADALCIGDDEPDLDIEEDPE